MVTMTTLVICFIYSDCYMHSNGWQHQHQDLCSFLVNIKGKSVVTMTIVTMCCLFSDWYIHSNGCVISISNHTGKQYILIWYFYTLHVYGAMERSYVFNSFKIIIQRIMFFNHKINSSFVRLFRDMLFLIFIQKFRKTL